MGLDNTMTEEESVEQPSKSGNEQRKSLIANSYSTSLDDEYKDITGWGLDEDEIERAYKLNAPQGGGSAAVQTALNGLFAGGHEEFYSRLQLALAHVFGRSQQIRELDEAGVEARGSVPVMQLLNIESSDAVDYFTAEDVDVEITAEDIAQILDSNPEVAEELQEVMQEAEPAEA